MKKALAFLPFLVLPVIFLFALSSTGVSAQEVDGSNCNVVCKTYTKNVADGKTLNIQYKLVQKVTVKVGNLTDTYNFDEHSLGVQEGAKSKVTLNKNSIVIEKTKEKDIKSIEVCTTQPEEHNLTVQPVCYDQNTQKYLWDIYNSDETRAFYPVKLAYSPVCEKCDVTKISPTLKFNNKSDNPLRLETSEDSIEVYWKNDLTQKWQWDAVVTAQSNGVMCETPQTESHELTLTFMCKDTSMNKWVISSQDEVADGYPLTLGYQIGDGVITQIPETLAFGSTMNISTMIGEQTLPVSIYWYNNGEWVYLTKATPASNMCEQPAQGDEGEVLGESTVKGSTTVVLAHTGVPSSFGVIAGEVLLLSVTLASGVLLIKKYN